MKPVASWESNKVRDTKNRCFNDGDRRRFHGRSGRAMIYQPLKTLRRSCFFFQPTASSAIRLALGCCSCKCHRSSLRPLVLHRLQFISRPKIAEHAELLLMIEMWVVVLVAARSWTNYIAQHQEHNDRWTHSRYVCDHASSLYIGLYCGSYILLHFLQTLSYQFL